MGNFCEQYGILSIAPSQRKYKELITKKRITKATQIITQPPTKDGDELGSDTTMIFMGHRSSNV